MCYKLTYANQLLKNFWFRIIFSGQAKPFPKILINQIRIKFNVEKHLIYCTRVKKAEHFFLFFTSQHMYPFSWSRLGQSEATDGLFIEKETLMNPATMQQQDSSIMRPINFTLIVHGTILYILYTISSIHVQSVLYSVHIEKSVIK
jgi:hypothetical protein